MLTDETAMVGKVTQVEKPASELKQLQAIQFGRQVINQQNHAYGVQEDQKKLIPKAAPQG